MAKTKPTRNFQPQGQIVAGLMAATNQIIASVAKQDWKRVELYAKNLRDRIESIGKELDKKDLTPEEDEPPIPADEEKEE